MVQTSRGGRTRPPRLVLRLRGYGARGAPELRGTNTSLGTHPPGAGVVIKHNANQRYATDAITGYLFRELGERAGVPVQEFVVRSDLAAEHHWTHPCARTPASEP